MGGWDNVVGYYRLDGPGIESRWGRDFLHLSRPALGLTQPPVHGYRVFPGVKRPGYGANHPPPSNCRAHERVELYLYSPSGLQAACFRENLYLYLLKLI